MARKILNEELKRLDVEAFKAAKKQPVIILLDNIRSRNNVGSVFRTSDAFLIEQIILSGITPTPPHRDIYKTALGATESVSWSHTDNILETISTLQKEGYQIIAVEQVESAIKLHEFSLGSKEKIVLVFGSEVGGVQQAVVDVSDVCLEIPQLGTKHSLNISVSTGIVLWHLLSSRF